MKKHIAKRKVNMKHKKIVSIIGALFLIISAIALITGCTQGNSNKNNANSDWMPVSNKNDLVGTWATKLSNSGLVWEEIFSVASDFNGHIEINIDYSTASSQVSASINELKSVLLDGGFSVDHNATNKKIKATPNFTSTDLQEMIPFIKLNSSKTKIKFTKNGEHIEYTKR